MDFSALAIASVDHSTPSVVVLYLPWVYYTFCAFTNLSEGQSFFRQRHIQGLAQGGGALHHDMKSELLNPKQLNIYVIASTVHNTTPWLYYTFRGCAIPTMGVLYLLCI